jgi:hypothetical protein
MASAAEERRELDAASDVERSDTLGCVELVPGDREQVDTEIANVDLNFSNGLGRVRVDSRSRSASRATRFAKRLQDAGLAVCMQDAHQRARSIDHADQILHPDLAIAIHANAGHPPALPLEPIAGSRDGRMLDR